MAKKRVTFLYRDGSMTVSILQFADDDAALKDLEDLQARSRRSTATFSEATVDYVHSMIDMSGTVIVSAYSFDNTSRFGYTW